MFARKPVVAGRFYPADPVELEKEIDSFFSDAAATARKKTWAVMLPHAGYVFCGDVIAHTLASMELPARLIVLCPNHTGYGQPMGVWPDGIWETPLGEVAVDAALAKALIETGTGFSADTQSHLGEHSIEVLLPFLQKTKGNRLEGIVPVCVGSQSAMLLEMAGQGLARVIRKNPDVGLVVSSDMNHYESEKRTLEKDALALAAAEKADPAELLRTVARNEISMCGAAPLALALYAGSYLGKLDVEVVAHDTSARASGDAEHCVGYAGLRIWLHKN